MMQTNHCASDYATKTAHKDDETVQIGCNFENIIPAKKSGALCISDSFLMPVLSDL